METLLELRNVMKYYPILAGGILWRKYRMCRAVDDVSFSVAKQSCFGVAGESGSGKTTLAKLILLMERVTGGSITFEGKDILSLDRKDLMWYRRRVQAVCQDSASSLNPRLRIKDIVSEPLEVQQGKRLSRGAIHEKTEQILRNVGLDPAYLRKYPHELSGGQKQRVAIARAVVLEPSLVILDEPASSLDVSIRAQILNLLADIQERQGLTYIIIAHDLAMLQHVTTHIAVMYLGRIVEMGCTDAVFGNPLHPYTKALFAAVPWPEPGRVKTSSALSGEIGSPIDPPAGCRFHNRCAYSRDECRQIAPPLARAGPGHQVACHLAAAGTGCKCSSLVELADAAVRRPP